MECRNIICVECTTQFEGINRCSACLAVKLSKVKRAPTRQEWSVSNISLALLAAGLFYGSVYFLVALAQ